MYVQYKKMGRITDPGYKFIIYANIFIHLWPKDVIHTVQPANETWFNSMEQHESCPTRKLATNLFTLLSVLICSASAVSMSS